MSLLYALALGCAIGYTSIAGYKVQPILTTSRSAFGARAVLFVLRRALLNSVLLAWPNPASTDRAHRQAQNGLPQPCRVLPEAQQPRGVRAVPYLHGGLHCLPGTEVRPSLFLLLLSVCPQLNTTSRDIPAAAAAAPLAAFHLHTFVNHGGTAQYDSTRIFQTLPQAELRQKVLCCAGVAVAAFLLYRTCVELRIWEAFDALHARALKLIMPSLAMGDDFAQQWVHAHA